MKSSLRSHACASISQSQDGLSVTLGGWVNARRDHGGVIFVDLRDASGIMQIVFDPNNADSFAVAESVRNEFVISVSGRVRLRPQGTENPSIPTGMVEVVAASVEILNRADNLPFQPDEGQVNEGTRLKYRYLDLRSEKMQHNLRLRHRLIQSIRQFLDENSFTEIETPILTRYEQPTLKN